VVTPEVTFVAHGLASASHSLSARAGSLGDICASQIQMLCAHGADVHLALPNYRNLFKINAHRLPGLDVNNRFRELPEINIHLAQDRSFYYHPKLFADTHWENLRIALAFQREVVNRIIPMVQPDLIHCHGWMTGLIPAMARSAGIPCVFTVYSLDSAKVLLATVEELGIDMALFWQNCFYDHMPVNYEETRSTNPLDLLTTGVFAARVVHTLSHGFLRAVIDGHGSDVDPALKGQLQVKLSQANLYTVSAVPDSSFNPMTDRALMRPYGQDTHAAGKMYNKLYLQETLGLSMDSTCPVCLWPTRLDGSRPGCRLMADTLGEILQRYSALRLQVVFVANGNFQDRMHEVINQLGATDRAVVCDFDARRYRLAFGGADFVLMPLYLDTCALPCKIGQRYGALPIAYDAGAIQDCVTQLDPERHCGTGFLFKYFDAKGLLWAMDCAMDFFNKASALRSRQIQRIMADSLERFAPETMAHDTINLYTRTLGRSWLQLNADSLVDTASQIAA
jgi:starch synthase